MTHTQKLWIAAALVGLFAGLMAPTRARCQEEAPIVICDPDGECWQTHPPEHKQLHDLFYEDWNRLDTGDSCCSKNDCFPTIMIEDTSTGQWWALRQDPMKELESLQRNGQNPRVPQLGAEGMWVEVPQSLLEHNSMRLDLGVKRPRSSRPSPDGRSHACIAGGHVLCAVVGGGM